MAAAVHPSRARQPFPSHFCQAEHCDPWADVLERSEITDDPHLAAVLTERFGRELSARVPLPSAVSPPDR